MVVTDEARAALKVLVLMIGPGLVIFNFVDWTADQLAFVDGFVGAAITVLFLFWKTGQGDTVKSTGVGWALGGLKPKKKKRKEG